MSKECFEIGRIQAFLDGELAPAEATAFTGHTAECRDCATSLAIAEDENSVVFSALDRELDSLVPTQRLWTRISESIDLEKSREPLRKKLYGYIAAQLLNPSFAAAAGVLIVFGFVAAVIMLDPSDGSVLTSGPQIAVPKVTFVAPNAGFPATSGVADLADKSDGNTLPTNEAAVKRSNVSPEELQRLVVRTSNPRPSSNVRPQYSIYLPGEESYLKTIDELQRNAMAQNASMNASGQVAFQRDLAVVNDSIEKMKKVVRKNPRNQSARQVLYSAYQDKIDLLNSAAQRNELMASLQ